jgi:hypothetical protein
MVMSGPTVYLSGLGRVTMKTGCHGLDRRQRAGGRAAASDPCKPGVSRPDDRFRSDVFETENHLAAALRHVKNCDCMLLFC